MLATERRRLEAEKQQAGRLLETAELHARDIESALDGALAKTKTPHATYLASTPLAQPDVLYAYPGRRRGTIDSTELTPVYAALSAWEPRLGKPRRHLKAVPSPTKGPGSATQRQFGGANRSQHEPLRAIFRRTDLAWRRAHARHTRFVA